MLETTIRRVLSSQPETALITKGQEKEMLWHTVGWGVWLDLIATSIATASRVNAEGDDELSDNDEPHGGSEHEGEAELPWAKLCTWTALAFGTPAPLPPCNLVSLNVLSPSLHSTSAVV